MSPGFEVAAADRLLTTTRAVRRRLDLAGQVPDDVVRACLEIAQQAPSGSNSSSARWIVVRDPERRRQLADLYRLGLGEYARATVELEQRGFEGRVNADADSASTQARDAQTKRVFASARHLTEHLHEVPVLVVPCLLGRLPDAYDNFRAAAFYGSIHPAIWSFMLALRTRGYGSVYTSLHLVHERDAAEVLEIPDHVTQVGLIPVAPFLGEDFRPADRGPIDEVVAVDRWDFSPGAEPSGSVRSSVGR